MSSSHAEGSSPTPSRPARRALTTATALSTPGLANSDVCRAHNSAAFAPGSSLLMPSMPFVTAGRSSASRAISAGFTSPRALRLASGGQISSSLFNAVRSVSASTPDSSHTARSASSSACSFDSDTWCSCTDRPISAHGGSFFPSSRRDPREEPEDSAGPPLPPVAPGAVVPRRRGALGRPRSAGPADRAGTRRVPAEGTAAAALVVARMPVCEARARVYPGRMHRAK